MFYHDGTMLLFAHSLITLAWHSNEAVTVIGDVIIFQMLMKKQMVLRNNDDESPYGKQFHTHSRHRKTRSINLNIFVSNQIILSVGKRGWKLILNSFTRRNAAFLQYNIAQIAV